MNNYKYIYISINKNYPHLQLSKLPSVSYLRRHRERIKSSNLLSLLLVTFYANSYFGKINPLHSYVRFLSQELLCRVPPFL